jgi:hypothetical protein
VIVNLIIIFLIISIGTAFLGINKRHADNSRHRKRYIVLICAILVLQSGLRNVAVGADTYAYYQQFEDVKIVSWSQILDTSIGYYSYGIGKDPGYIMFQKIAQLLFPNYQLFLFLIAGLFFIALGSFIYKNTTSIRDAIIAFVLYSSLFYSFFSITGHRQTIATACTLFSYEFIKKRKLLPFLLLIIIGSAIHRSCLVFIPLYFIAFLHFTKFLYALALVSFPFVMVFRYQINELLSGKSGYGHYGIFEGAGTFTFTAMLLLVAVIGLLRMKAVMRFKNENWPPYNGFALAIILTPLTWVNPIGMRIVQYFSLFLLLLIPAIIKSLEQKSIKIMKLVYVTAVVLLIVLFVKSSWDQEYSFFWQEMDLPENYI